MIYYSYDAVTISNNQDNLLHVYKYSANIYNMKEATQYLVITVKPESCKIVINGDTIDQILKFNLGTELSSYGPISELVRKRARWRHILRDGGRILG